MPLVATDAETTLLRRIGPWGGVLLMLLFAWVVGRDFVRHRGLRQDARAACAAAGKSDGECAALLQARDQQCWDRCCQWGTRNRQSAFDPLAYQQCMAP